MLPGIVGPASLTSARFLFSIATVGMSSQSRWPAGKPSRHRRRARHLLRRVQRSGSEAPALVSRAAPREARGAATGLYSSVHSSARSPGARFGGTLAHCRIDRGARRVLRRDARLVRGAWNWATSCRCLRARRARVDSNASTIRKGRNMASVNTVILIGNLGRDPETPTCPRRGDHHISVATTDV